MIEFIIGAITVIISILIGHRLGRDENIVNEGTKKKIKQIFNRVVPDNEVGIIERPTPKDNFYRDNPKAKQEDEIMTEGFDTLNQ